MRVTLLFLAMWYAHPTVGQPRMAPAKRLDHEWHLALDRQAVAHFPPRDEVDRCWELARAHVAWLDGQIEMAFAVEPHWVPHWREWERDARFCLRAWSLLDQCRSRWNTSSERACYLFALEQHLGRDAFLAGDMPPPMPVWWFRTD